jgi:hypothetical protein
MIQALYINRSARGKNNSVRWCPGFEAWQYLSRVVPDTPGRAVFKVLVLDNPELKTAVFNRDHRKASISSLI